MQTSESTLISLFLKISKSFCSPVITMSVFCQDRSSVRSLCTIIVYSPDGIFEKYASPLLYTEDSLMICSYMSCNKTENLPSSGTTFSTEVLNNDTVIKFSSFSFHRYTILKICIKDGVNYTQSDNQKFSLFGIILNQVF